MQDARLIPRPIAYLFLSLGAQLLALLLVSLFAKIFANWWTGTTSTLGVQIIIVIVLSVWIGLPKSWLTVNALIPLVLFVSTVGHLPNTLIIVILVFMLLVNLPTFWTRVPYYPTSLPIYEELASIIGERNPKTFIDLGCGFGSLLIFLAERYPGTQFNGVEIAPLTYFIALIRARIRGIKNISITHQSLWKVQLASFDMVYAFLAPDPMVKLWKKASEEMQAGSLFITNTFEVPSPANKIIVVSDKHNCRLMLHYFE